MEKQIKIALAGNPNCGKTTLFNALTGSNQFVGNWPGVTVEKKEGKLKKHDDVVIMDLPGIYTLTPYTLVVGCDMPLLNPDLLRFLVARAAEDGGPYDAIVPRFEGVPHGPGRNVVDDADAPAINNKAKASGRQGAFDLALSEELALRRGRAVR